MSYVSTSFGPRDDWDPQGLSDEDQTTEDLAALGMHTTSGKDDEKEEEEEKEEGEKEGDGDVKKGEEEVKEEEEEEVDELKELDRLERALQNDGRSLGEEEEE